MKLKYYLLALLGIAGFSSCSNDEVSTTNPTEGVDTYVNFSVILPGSSTSRALPDDYNPDGVYEGNDGVETLDIYMQSSDGTIEVKRFSGSEITSTGEIVSLSQPFRTISGNKNIYIVLNNPNPLGTTITNENDFVPTTGLAKVKTVNGVDYDVITMTGKASNVIIEPDITQQGVVQGANHVKVDVTRMASRVIVTSSASTDVLGENGTKIGTVSDLTYSVAQGTNKIYFIGQTDYSTWGSSYVPDLGEYVDQAFEYYDYSDLTTPEAIPAKPTPADGYKSLKGKFLFENTHTYGATTKTTEYRKGNTAYVLVRATFTPEAGAIADGGALTNGTFYIGQSDGKIYSSKIAAQAAVQNQKVSVYEEGKMLQFAWLNPDKIDTPLNSPVLRNHIYHINITGFKKIGFNWNPLYPEEPDTTTPENPDPKPINPDEPDSSIDPLDPLTPEETYMTVEVTVLDWLVHSYDIEF